MKLHQTGSNHWKIHAYHHSCFFFRAISSANGKEQFLKQLEQIIDGVQQNRVKVERRQQEEKSKRDFLNTQLSQLIEKARQYAKVLKDFQEVTLSKQNKLLKIFTYLFFYFRLYERMNILHQNLNNFFSF